MIKNINIDIDYKKLLDEFYYLKVDDLLKKSLTNQVSVQCDKNSHIDLQLTESCGSLWYNLSNLKADDFLEINFLECCKENTIFFEHNLNHKEPIVFGKQYQGQQSIPGLNFEKTYYVNVISNTKFQLFLDKDLKKLAKPVLNRKIDVCFRIFRKVSEYRFDTVCDYFKSTYVEYLLNKIQELYPIYRTRFMLSHPKTNLTWHRDLSKRIHVPIYTNDDCFMVIENSVVRLPFGSTYLVDTTKYHTAVNASKVNRVHLVACL